ncbi:complement component C8 gamma chain [Pholidichthys leucotaenia]
MARLWCCMLAVLVLMCVCLWSSTEAVGGAKSRPKPQRRRQATEKAIELASAQSMNLHLLGLIRFLHTALSFVLCCQELLTLLTWVTSKPMTGKWYLLYTASKCSYLINRGTSVEPTVMTLSISPESNQMLSVSTKTRHNHQCWEIMQVYYITSTPGVLFLKGSNPKLNTEIVIADTDHNSYAIMYYKKLGKVTMKLYVRSVGFTVSEPLLTKFEELAEKENMPRAYHFPFPSYSKSEKASQNMQ